MIEVELTVEQASRALGIKISTVRAYCRGDGGFKAFPRAHLLHRSLQKGYRIPEGDIIAYAQMQGDTVLLKAREVIAEARKAANLAENCA